MTIQPSSVKVPSRQSPNGHASMPAWLVARGNKEESEQGKVKRILLMVAYNILIVPYYWFKLCYYASHVDKYTEEERYKLLSFIDNRAITGGRI